MGYQIYQTQWNAEIGARLTTTLETRPGALAEDKYTIAETIQRRFDILQSS